MTEVVGVRERPEVCSRCGHAGRVVVMTESDLTDRCYHCGYERRRGFPVDIEVAGKAASQRHPAPRPANP